MTGNQFLYVAYCPKSGISRLGMSRTHNVDTDRIARALSRLTRRKPHCFAFSVRYTLRFSTDYAAKKAESRIRARLETFRAPYGVGWFDGCSWNEVVSTVKRVADIQARFFLKAS
jgi:hypothetical protein